MGSVVRTAPGGVQALRAAVGFAGTCGAVPAAGQIGLTSRLRAVSARADGAAFGASVGCRAIGRCRGHLAGDGAGESHRQIAIADLWQAVENALGVGGRAAADGRPQPAAAKFAATGLVADLRASPPLTQSGAVHGAAAPSAPLRLTAAVRAHRAVDDAVAILAAFGPAGGAAEHQAVGVLSAGRGRACHRFAGAFAAAFNGVAKIVVTTLTARTPQAIAGAAALRLGLAA